jgi:hypothetical protein
MTITRRLAEEAAELIAAAAELERSLYPQPDYDAEQQAKPIVEEAERVVLSRALIAEKRRMAEILTKLSARNADPLSHLRYAVSARDIGLVLQEPSSRPTVTVENYCKWYALYVLHPNGLVSEVDFGQLEAHSPGVSAYLDHAPNPAAVVRWAMANSIEVDVDSLELMIARWVTERTGGSGPALNRILTALETV